MWRWWSEEGTFGLDQQKATGGEKQCFFLSRNETEVMFIVEKRNQKWIYRANQSTGN